MDTVVPGLLRRPSMLRGSQHPVNTYIWLRDGGVVLIDPSADVTPQVVRGVTEGRVTEIIITHLQDENAGGVLNFPDAKVHVPAGDEYLTQGPEAYRKLIHKWSDPWEWETRGNFLGHLAGAANERPLPRPVKLAEPLRPGAQILGGRVLATPGHGKHAVTFVAMIGGKQVAFCGDLIHAGGKMWNWFDSEWDYGLLGGPIALRASLDVLAQENADVLCPTHGPAITAPVKDIKALSQRIDAVLAPLGESKPGVINFDEVDSPAQGFRVLLPNLHQWRTGNCAALISKTGEALLIDDGLCYWKPLAERARHHDAVIADLKRSLGITRVSMVIPTHYHGDHIENIPDLQKTDRLEIVSLDTVADVLEYPERFNLTCPLPFYDTAYDTVKVDRRVTSGTRIKWNEFELEIFHLGGQTYYHAGITATIAGVQTLFVGDAIGGMGTACEPAMSYNDGEPATRGWAYALDRMIERKPGLIVCGHGIAVKDPMDFLTTKRALWETRIRQFHELSARADPRLFFDPFV